MTVNVGQFPYRNEDVSPSTETTTTEVTTVTKEKWVDGKLVEKTVDTTEKTVTTARKQPQFYITYNTNSANIPNGPLASTIKRELNLMDR